MGKPNIRTVIAFVVLATFFISCDRNVVFDEDRRVDEKGWHVSDALVFNYEATDTSNIFQTYISLLRLSFLTALWPPIPICTLSSPKRTVVRWDAKTGVI